MDALEKTQTEVEQQKPSASETAADVTASETVEPEGEETAEQTDKDKKARSVKDEIIEWIKAFVFAGVIVALVFGFVIRPVEVKGHSMEPTLQNSDRLIEWMLFYTPT